MKRSLVYTAIFLFALGLGALAAQQPSPMPARRNERDAEGRHRQLGRCKITFGDKSATWTAATLAALPHTTVTVHNEHTKADETYSGVPLIALLTPLGVTDKPRGKDLRLYVVAAGSDGYEVVYSIGEVTPDVHDATVMVADTENGAPINADGPLKLVATGEKRPARWVRNLVSITVRTAQ